MLGKVVLAHKGASVDSVIVDVVVDVIGRRQRVGKQHWWTTLVDSGRVAARKAVAIKGFDAHAFLVDLNLLSCIEWKRALNEGGREMILGKKELRNGYLEELV